MKVSRLFFRQDTVLRPWVLRCLPSLRNSKLKALVRAIPILLTAKLIARQCWKKTEKTSVSLRLLTLDHTRFRDDLEALNRYSQIELILLPNWVQRWVTTLIQETSPQSGQSISRTPPKSAQNEFLRRLLRALSQHLKIDGLLSSGFYYAQNEKWEEAAVAEKLAFFCIHRELVGAEAQAMRELWKDQVSQWRKFKGHAIMLSSTAAKEMLQHRNYFDPSKIYVTGLPRFDIGIKQSKESRPSSVQTVDQPLPKPLVLFSFPIATAQPQLRQTKGTFPDEGGFKLLFSSVHQLVARFARDNPSVPVIIRPKWYAGAWKMRIDQEMQAVFGNNERWPQNLRIIDNVGAQQLLQESGIVISLNSTTGIEAIIHSVPSILPHFCEASGALAKHLLISKDTSPFYVARSEQDLENYLDQYLHGALQAKPVKAQFLEKVLGPSDGNASKRIEEIMILLTQEIVSSGKTVAA